MTTSRLLLVPEWLLALDLAWDPDPDPAWDLDLDLEWRRALVLL